MLLTPFALSLWISIQIQLPTTRLLPAPGQGARLNCRCRQLCNWLFG